jgi:hypothetical protein
MLFCREKVGFLGLSASPTEDPTDDPLPPPRRAGLVERFFALELPSGVGSSKVLEEVR